MDNVNYFYWNEEPLRKDDWEPVAKDGAKYGDVILSRYHFDLLTIWTNSVMMNNKPKVGFSYAFHTPLVECRDYELEGGNASRNLKELIWLRGLISAFITVPLREAKGNLF